MKESNRVEEFRVGNYVVSAKSGSLQGCVYVRRSRRKWCRY